MSVKVTVLSLALDAANRLKSEHVVRKILLQHHGLKRPNCTL